MILTLFRRLALATLAALLPASPLLAADAMDELSRRVAAYELTLPKVEAYGNAVTAIADWAAASPKDAAALNRRAPKPGSDLQATISFIEKESAFMSVLNRHQLSGADYVLIPAATMQAGIAVLGVQQGRSFPADRINPKNIALVQANQARIDAIMTKVRGDQARIAGRAK